MNRAIVALTVGVLVVVLLGLGSAPHPVAAAVVTVVVGLLTTWGFVQVRRRGTRVAAAYFAVQLPLGFLLLGLSGATTGSLLVLVVLVIQAVLVLPLGWALLVAVLVPLVHVGMAWGDGLREGMGTLVAVLLAAVLTHLHVSGERARAEAAAANEQLRRYAAQAEELATTRERNRLARDIHDGLGHHLTVVQMQLQAARSVLGSDPHRAEELLVKAQRQSQDALAEVRRSVGALREPSGAALPDVLDSLAADSRDGGLETSVLVHGTRRDLSPDATESLFRSAQEGLTNVRKHAGARHAEVVLDYRRPDVVRLEIRDDGRGLEHGNGVPDGIGVDARHGAVDRLDRGGFGLPGLAERVARLGGTVRVTPSGGSDGPGFTLCVEVPG